MSQDTDAPGVNPEAGESLNDLWHWNGDLKRPAWTRVGTGTFYVSPADTFSSHDAAGDVWPPRWRSAQGWTSDAAGQLGKQ